MKQTRLSKQIFQIEIIKNFFRLSFRNYLCCYAFHIFSQVKPRQAISIAAWVKLDTNKGYHSIFDTIGGHSLHQKGQYHFEVQDGSVRWFHRNESNVQIFSVETGK